MYKYFDTFLLRTPYFSFSALPDFETKRCESVFREMLQVATPDLNEGLDKDTDKALFSALRYYQRACTRSTPFGLFAGCSVGTIGKSTEIRLLEQKMYNRVTRLDMNYICALTQQIEKDKSVREKMSYYPNSSIYSVGNHLRYVEYHYQKTRRMHKISQIENSEYLQRVLVLAKEGALFIEMVKALVDEEVTKEDATEFIHDLIDAQWLVSELEPAVTNVFPLTTLIAKLKTLPSMDQRIIGILSKIENQLNDIDQQYIGSTNDIYAEIIKNIELTKVESEIKYLFQTDMFKPVQQVTVSNRLLKDIQKALIFLNKISIPPTRTNLSQFRDNFYKRYEDCEIPLLFALDNELGIGYSGNNSGDISPLVDDMMVPLDNPPSNLSLSPFQSVLMYKYQLVLQKGEKYIELTDEDVKGIEVVWDDLPPTISVMCQILQDDDNGRTVYIKSTGGQSATNLLGRFCHLNKQILNHTLTITEKEAEMNGDVIFAEITHLPESRIGNILLRPVLRSHEIAYLAKAGVSKEFEISPEDLFISVRNNRVVLQSKRLNKEIVPRMSTAHNYSGQNSMPVYHFLCDLQHQKGRNGLAFRWNEAAQMFDYLPRVVYKNCILSQARWIVREKEIKGFCQINDDSEFLIKVKEWKNGRNIPDMVLLADGDNELYVDLNHPLSIRAWLSVVKKRPFFLLEELLFNPATAVVHGPEGVFTNEFIFAFYRE